MAEVAQVLSLTPAYVKGVVTFYTMYHQHPVGKYFVQVCTTSPCNVCDRNIVKAFLEHTKCGELGVTSADGNFTVIEVECLGACGFATPWMVQDEFLESVTPGSVPGHPRQASPNGLSALRRIRGRRRSSRSTSAIRRRARSTGWGQARRLQALREGARHGAGRHRGHRQGVRAARPRRRRLSDGDEVVVHEAGRRQAALPELQRRRVRAGHLQGSRDHALDAARARRGMRDRRLRDRRGEGATSTSAASSPSRSVDGRKPCKEAYEAGILGKNAMGTGKTSTFTCTRAPAPTSAARRRRS